MLYGNTEVQTEILEQVKNFEKKYNKKVIFGAMVGSISKGLERYDSDYDTRFLYLDQSEHDFVRWDKIEGEIAEEQIHMCYIPERMDCYIGGSDYRDKYREYELGDKSYFYDKIAFWELTSFINFLKKPKLDNKFSVGLYHIVSWTFNSPYCWDPYGIASKINCLLDEMFVPEYEIQYYRNYILKAQKKEPMMIREYLYSAYYALAIEYCLKHNRFAPVYFKSLLAMCMNERLEKTILELERGYYELVAKAINSGKGYERKMADLFSTYRNDIIDNFLNEVLAKTEKYQCNDFRGIEVNYVGEIIEIILDSLKRPEVKDINVASCKVFAPSDR